MKLNNLLRPLLIESDESDQYTLYDTNAKMIKGFETLKSAIEYIDWYFNFETGLTTTPNDIKRDIKKNGEAPIIMSGDPHNRWRHTLKATNVKKVNKKAKYRLYDVGAGETISTFSSFDDAYEYARNEWYQNDIKPSKDEIKKSLKRFGDTKINTTSDNGWSYAIWLELIK